MKIRIVKLIALCIALGCALSAVLFKTEASRESEVAASQGTGFGSVETLEANYKAWEAIYVKNGGDRNMILPLNSNIGLSTEQTNAYGSASLDLIDGLATVEIIGASDADELHFWLIDNRSKAGETLLPEAGDAMLHVGILKREGETLKLQARLGSDAFVGFEPDLAVVARAGKSPIQDRLLTGQPSLFQKLYYSGKRGRFGSLPDFEQTAKSASSKGLFDKLIDYLNPAAEAQIGPIPNPTTAMEQLITQGRNLFFNEAFGGNGRSCGACHRENNNFTIDPEFISTLPPNDPLFIAEFTPALSQNFEKPILMRKFGLILENVDGFDDLQNKFVMRSVPHTLALLQDTLTPAELDETHPPFVPVPPLERLGWGGDGAPVGSFTLPNGAIHQASGTLRDFMIGAIIQHYTKTLNRVQGVDFQLPTVAQLDALEAFQKSLGRRENPKLAGPGALKLKDVRAQRGLEIFNNPGQQINPNTGGFLFNGPTQGAGRCLLCHFNGGAADFFEVPFFGGSNDPGVGVATGNSNFDTGVEDQPSRPATLLVPSQIIPPDAGFGRDPIMRDGKFLGFGNAAATITNQRGFNTPVVVEAADTGPFFHDNSITTIEGAVEFYNSDSFNNSPIGQVIKQLDPNGRGIKLEATEVEAVAAFLRAVNALENIRSSVDLQQRGLKAVSFAQAQELLKLSISELEDAIKVLDGADLHPEAQKKLLQAAALNGAALVVPSQSGRNALINQAIAFVNSARADIVAQ